MSPCPDKEAVAIDALTAPWPSEVLYAFPPFDYPRQSPDQASSGTPPAACSGGSSSRSSGMVSYVESARQMGAANTEGDARAPAAALELCPPAARIALFGGMVHNVEGMSGRGYSSKVIKALGDARASSTNKVYDSIWRLFATFCSSRGIVPEVATPPRSLSS